MLSCGKAHKYELGGKMPDQSPEEDRRWVAQQKFSNNFLILEPSPTLHAKRLHFIYSEGKACRFGRLFRNLPGIA